MSDDKRTYGFGPLILKSKIPEDMRVDLLERVNKAVVPYNNKLASIIDDVRELRVGDQVWLADALYPYACDYLKAIEERADDTSVDTVAPEFKTIALQAAWVNFQKRYEINTEHYHKGNISFSVYLSIPPELVEEHDSYIGTGSRPGSIVFRYGEVMNFSVVTTRFLPEEGDILLFPSWLHHYVTPYKTNCTRISMAGNFVLY